VRRGRVGSLAASPTLVGAVTVLVVVVAVFLAYQANSGLPFVPTYRLSAQLPDANSLVRGNDVRIGGERVGQITAITPENVDNAPCPGDPTRLCATQVAKVEMDLNKDLEQLPNDSTIVVRSRSTRSSTCSTARPGTRSRRTCSSSATRWRGAAAT
jgi:ABC-type transporter Mla subunit MlaD